MAIKTHLQSNDSDTNLFIDVDLSILGQDWNIYSKYYKNIILNLYRQREFPRKKKKKKLNYFLGLEKYTKRIFYEKSKNNVRKNLFIELKELNTII
ncbi:hypothetical protein LEP1GSC088_2486 [Leptospira interrogans str. L1207]|nr:hypothetical protein LEP1GSC088_2486 [Leptospira interrogans str. L1207]